MKCRSLTSVSVVVLTAVLIFLPLDAQADHRFEVSSTTFANRTTLPISTINNIVPPNGVNVCTPDGSPGGDQSPELSWTHPDDNTRSFVVVAYDVTAAFTHWGMYNIPATTTELPENAGVADSTYGTQIVNDAGSVGYYGPCPPPNLEPVVHKYVFTVYALDIELNLPSSTNFPANSETLYLALIKAGRTGHILESANIVGFYSSVPPQ